MGPVLSMLDSVGSASVFIKTLLSYFCAFSKDNISCLAQDIPAFFTLN